ncbi:MAG: archease [Thaumarchaeota archaeon]|nr:MAG: archease [Nitrososphaerota archaeon]
MNGRRKAGTTTPLCPSDFSITSLSLTSPSRRGGERSLPSSRAARGRPRKVERITLTSDSTENLLYDFLTDLIIRKDVESILFKEFLVSLDKSGRKLKCVARGELIDRKRHRLRNDVKAVTTHLFGIKRSDKGFSATVVLDI